jgi:hypothetical protein
VTEKKIDSNAKGASAEAVFVDVFGSWRERKVDGRAYQKALRSEWQRFEKENGEGGAF